MQIQEILDAIENKDTNFIDHPKNFNEIKKLLQADPKAIISVFMCLIIVADKYAAEDNNFENLLYFFDKLRSMELNLEKKTEVTYALAHEIKQKKLFVGNGMYVAPDSQDKLMLLTLLVTELRWDYPDDESRINCLDRVYILEFMENNIPVFIEKIIYHAERANLTNLQKELNAALSRFNSQAKTTGSSSITVNQDESMPLMSQVETSTTSKSRSCLSFFSNFNPCSWFSSDNSAKSPGVTQKSRHAKVLTPIIANGNFKLALDYIEKNIPDSDKRSALIQELNNPALTKMYNDSIEASLSSSSYSIS